VWLEGELPVMSPAAVCERMAGNVARLAALHADPRGLGDGGQAVAAASLAAGELALGLGRGTVREVLRLAERCLQSGLDVERLRRALGLVRRHSHARYVEVCSSSRQMMAVLERGGVSRAARAPAGAGRGFARRAEGLDVGGWPTPRGGEVFWEPGGGGAPEPLDDCAGHLRPSSVPALAAAAAAGPPPGLPEPRFAVGHAVRHRRYGYRGVVFGWDWACEAARAWQAQMGVASLPRGPRQPFYRVLVDARDRPLGPGGVVTYVAEDNAAPLEAEAGGPGAAPVLHPSLGALFRGVAPGPGGVRYVPGRDLARQYIADAPDVRECVLVTAVDAAGRPAEGRLGARSAAWGVRVRLGPGPALPASAFPPGLEVDSDAE